MLEIRRKLVSNTLNGLEIILFVTVLQQLIFEIKVKVSFNGSAKSSVAVT